MKQYRVGVLGATGMVGQRFVSQLARHPWFELTVLAASGRSAGKTYEEAMRGRWALTTPMPDCVRAMTVWDAQADAEQIAQQVDLVFCAVSLGKAEVRELEERYARLECPVVSNNSALRGADDVPMIIPEVNPEHCAVIETQRKRLGTRRGFVAVKSNCSLQSYVPALHPLRDLGLRQVLACTYQAVSGAGKTLDTWPEMRDNVIPYIGGEEEKSEREPLKIWGRVEGGVIVPAHAPSITAQCFRVPVSDGHMAAVFFTLDQKAGLEEVKERMVSYQGLPQRLGLPSAPRQFIHYFEEGDRPQTALDRDLDQGMAVSVGRLRPDTQFDYKFACLSHNTLRGAAGGAVLLAELLAEQGYFEEARP